METFYQGAKDVFLVGVRADFDALQNQALVSMSALEKYSIVGSTPMADALFTKISADESEGMRAVWRHVGTTGADKLQTRIAGGTYGEMNFIRTYETAVFDPNTQTAGMFKIPEERNWKEAKMYKDALDRAQKLMLKAKRELIQDPFETFNIAFTAPTSYPNVRFWARGNKGLDGNQTALGERLVSTQHARADGGATQSNAVTSGGVAQAFSDTSFWAAREQGFTFLDDIGDPAPRFAGKVTIVAANYNSIIRTAYEINNSDWQVQTAENQVNVHKGAIVSVKSHPVLLASAYAPSTIANPNQWHLVDEDVKETDVGTGLVCVEFIPQQSKVVRDETVDSIVYKLKQEYTYGFVEWRNEIGSPGSGAYSS